MIVLDTSAAIDLAIRNEPRARFVADTIADVDLIAVPASFDAELLSALRRLERAGVIDEPAALAAVTLIDELGLDRFALESLVARTWELRQSITIADGFFVALAEALDSPLLTTDAKLGRAHGHTAKIVAP
ncbi:MAG: type II toxin-antitoxin system VapC family toxin [Gaiellales bacterium]